MTCILERCLFNIFDLARPAGRASPIRYIDMVHAPTHFKFEQVTAVPDKPVVLVAGAVWSRRCFPVRRG